MALTDSFPTGDAGGLSIADTRLVMSGLIVKNADGSPRTGVFREGATPLVTGRASMGFDIAPFQAVTSRTGVGVELLANNSTMTVLTTAAPASNSRLDVIWVRPRFTDNADPSNVPSFGVTQGTAAAVPSKPSIPAGALELAVAEIQATDTTTETSVITQTCRFTVAAGGIVPFRNAAELNTWVASDGALARVGGQTMERVDGEWVPFGRDNPYIFLFRDATQGVPNAAGTTMGFPPGSTSVIRGGMAWDSSEWDVTVPVDGVYRVRISTEWDGNSSGRRDLVVQLNGLSVPGARMRDSSPSAVPEYGMGGTWDVLANAGDKIRGAMVQTSGGGMAASNRRMSIELVTAT